MKACPTCFSSLSHASSHLSFEHVFWRILPKLKFMLNVIFQAIGKTVSNCLLNTLWCVVDTSDSWHPDRSRISLFLQLCLTWKWHDWFFGAKPKSYSFASYFPLLPTCNPRFCWWHHLDRHLLLLPASVIPALFSQSACSSLSRWPASVLS